jgi:hypothetical protein
MRGSVKFFREEKGYGFIERHTWRPPLLAPDSEGAMRKGTSSACGSLEAENVRLKKLVA